MKSASSRILSQWVRTKSSTGPTLAGRAHPTQVSPEIGNALRCASRARDDVTEETPSSVSEATDSERQAFRLPPPPPKAAPAQTSAPLAASDRLSSSSSFSKSS